MDTPLVLTPLPPMVLPNKEENLSLNARELFRIELSVAMIVPNDSSRENLIQREQPSGALDTSIRIDYFHIEDFGQGLTGVRSGSGS